MGLFCDITSYNPRKNKMIKSIYRSHVLGAIILLAASLSLQSLTVSLNGAIQEEQPRRLQRFITFPRPDPDGVPTKVYVGIHVLDVMEIDDKAQTFKADFWGVIRWRDPRLAVEDSSGSALMRSFTMEEIWSPYLYILNQRNLSTYYDPVFRVDDEGNVLFFQRYYGDLSVSLDLKDFPLDKQKLPIFAGSFRYGPEELELVVNKDITGQRDAFTIEGWEVGEGEVQISTERFEVQNRDLARFDFILPAKRDFSYYLIKALIPLLLILFMAWAVFFIDPSALGPQIGIPTSSIFALILFMHRISGILPNISYLTRIDKFILFAIILVFLALGEAIVTSMLAFREKKELALKMDRWARFIYLFCVVFVFVYSFYL